MNQQMHPSLDDVLLYVVDDIFVIISRLGTHIFVIRFTMQMAFRNSVVAISNTCIVNGIFVQVRSATSTRLILTRSSWSSRLICTTCLQNILVELDKFHRNVSSACVFLSILGLLERRRDCQQMVLALAVPVCQSLICTASAVFKV